MNNLFKNNNFIIIGGPCAIESELQADSIAKDIHKYIDVYRGGAYKLRTNPSDFQGLEEEGLNILSNIKSKYNVKIVSEIVSELDIDKFKDIDIIQVGARNMYNYSLLKKLGKTNKTIILKRGISATVDEWIKAANYISSNGNNNIILCERGIRTFESSTRNTVDLSSVIEIKSKTNFKIIVDPSHGTGKSYMINDMAKAILAVGADGLMIEVHNNKKEALCDGEQSITPNEFNSLIKELSHLSKHFNKVISYEH